MVTPTSKFSSYGLVKVLALEARANHQRGRVAYNYYSTEHATYYFKLYLTLRHIQDLDLTTPPYSWKLLSYG
jgi:hypothetical protein